MATVQVYRLSDGKEFKALPIRCNQAEMFDLKNRGLWDLKTEGIATVKQYDDALNMAKVYRLVLGDGFARSDTFGFYRKGFEKAPVQIGTKLVWVENETINQVKTGRLLIAVLDLSKISGEKVRLADETETILSQAVGMGVIPLSKLKIQKIEDNSELVAYEVSVVSDFDPKTDLAVKNIARPRSWTTSVDSEGYPLDDGRVSDCAGYHTESARFSSVKHSDNFFNIMQLSAGSQELLKKIRITPEDIGWFGSFTRDNLGFYGERKRYIFAGDHWSDASHVAIVVSSATTQLETPTS